MLQLGLASALEVLHTAVCGEASGIPKSNWVLHSELVLEGADDHLLQYGVCATCGFGEQGITMVQVSSHCMTGSFYS